MEKLNQIDIQNVYNQIDLERESIIETLRDLIKIPSVVSESVADMPFGVEVHKAFSYVLNMAEENGFVCKNIDNFGGHIEYGSGKEIMGVLAHLDVVPASNSWTENPFGAEIKDNKIYGRGTMDDKGPLVASFFAMKILKEIGHIPDKKIRLVLGLDEETNWEGMKHYLSKEKSVDYGFTPDGDFPVINIEKGIIVMELAYKFKKQAEKNVELRSLKGGSAPNMVADYARAVIRSDNKEYYDYIRETAKSYKGNGTDIKIKGLGKNLEIIVRGKSAHGAEPELGENAISDIFEFLGEVEFTNESLNDFIYFYNRCIGKQLDGSNFGIGFKDEQSGSLILNVGLANIDIKSASITINLRYPISMDEEDVYSGIRKHCEKYNIGVIKKKHQRPIYIEENNKVIEQLMKVYQNHTGDLKTKPLCTGGGTYARAMENVVAFGPLMPNCADLAHQDDEFIDIEHLINLTKIYAQAIYGLTI